MKPFHRWLLWSSSALTGVTGLVYLWMEYALEPTQPWAVINHPLQPWVLKAHIVVAPFLVFSVGLIAGQHIWRHIRSRVRAGRRSGLLATFVLAPMILSGYLIQVITHAGWLSATSWIHVGTSVLYLGALVAHHKVFRTRVPRPARSEPAPATRSSAGHESSRTSRTPIRSTSAVSERGSEGSSAP